MYKVIMNSLYDVVYTVADGLSKMQADALLCQLLDTLPQSYIDNLMITSIEVKEDN
jgi:hypothetical protein